MCLISLSKLGIPQIDIITQGHDLAFIMASKNHFKSKAKGQAFPIMSLDLVPCDSTDGVGIGTLKATILPPSLLSKLGFTTASADGVERHISRSYQLFMEEYLRSVNEKVSQGCW